MHFGLIRISFGTLKTVSLGPYFQFDSCRIEPAGQVVYRGGDLVSLSAGEFAILLRLIEKRGETVEKRELSALIKEKEATKVKDESSRFSTVSPLFSISLRRMAN